MQDPAWHAAWKAKQAAGRRTLTDEQEAEILALRGQVACKEVMRRYRVADRTVRRIWRGELVVREMVGRPE